MPMLAFCYPALAVSLIYCIWLAHERAEFRRRERVLRDRVAFLLCMAGKQTPPRGLGSLAQERRLRQGQRILHRTDIATTVS
jgi:hypothetical protein